MAAMDTILLDLTEEIIKAMYQIDPNHNASEKFRSPKNLQTQKLEGQTGEPRLFEVTWGDPIGLDGGHSLKTWQITGTIKIGYPNETSWNIAKASDVQQIFTRFNVNDHGVTGVHYRQITEDEQPETEEAENDWLWMSVPLDVRLTTDE